MGEQVEHAMGELSAEHRALVELSVVRGVSDDEIAVYLGIDAERVRERRDAALHAVATGAGDGSADGRQMVIDHLRGESEPPVAQREPKPEPQPEPEPEPEPQDHARRNVLGPALVGGLLIAFTVALVLALRSNDDTAPTGGGADPAPSAGSPSPGGNGPRATLEPLAGGPAGGTALLVRRGDATNLQLRARGLPSPPTGGYVVWLYNSVSDARSLASSRKGRFRVSTPLPSGYKRYRYIDISREPADGNRNHSGQSVLRVALPASK